MFGIVQFYVTYFRVNIKNTNLCLTGKIDVNTAIIVTGYSRILFRCFDILK